MRRYLSYDFGRVLICLEDLNGVIFWASIYFSFHTPNETFAPFSRSYHHNPWFVHLMYRLLTHQPEVVSLLASDYAFKDAPPKFVRATLYHYHYSGDYPEGGADGVTDYWRRERRGSYFPIVDAEDPGLVNYLKGAGIISSSSSSISVKDFLYLEALTKIVRTILSHLGGFQFCIILLLLAVRGRCRW